MRQAVQSSIAPIPASSVAASRSSASGSWTAGREGGGPEHSTQSERDESRQTSNLLSSMHHIHRQPLEQSQRGGSSSKDDNSVVELKVSRRKMLKERRQQDISGGKEAVPIPWENDINDKEPPKEWTYAIKSFLYSDGISIDV